MCIRDRVRPLADGGEGTVTALVEGMNGTYEHVDVTGPMGQKVHATYGVLAVSYTHLDVYKRQEIMMCDNIFNAMEKTEIERADVRKLKRSMVN